MCRAEARNKEQGCLNRANSINLTLKRKKVSIDFVIICLLINTVIIFIGPPGAGKSTFWKTHMSEYVRINNDEIKSKPKAFKIAAEAIKAN
jgi:ABC-type multidrug transport system ATPase subunit